MIKLIILVLALAVGFGGGVYWGHQNPEAAGKLSAAEEKQFLEAQLAITQKIQAKLDSLTAKSSSSRTPAAGFLGSGQAPPAASSADVDELKSENQKQQAQLQKRIADLK